MGRKPFVLVRASTTKNSKVAPMTLHLELVAALRESLKGNASQRNQFSNRFPRIERFKRDLIKAGIPYQDALGRYGDFPSLRKTFGDDLG